MLWVYDSIASSNMNKFDIMSDEILSSFQLTLKPKSPIFSCVIGLKICFVADLYAF